MRRSEQFAYPYFFRFVLYSVEISLGSSFNVNKSSYKCRLIIFSLVWKYWCTTMLLTWSGSSCVMPYKETTGAHCKMYAQHETSSQEDLSPIILSELTTDNLQMSSVLTSRLLRVLLLFSQILPPVGFEPRFFLFLGRCFNPQSHTDKSMSVLTI